MSGAKMAWVLLGSRKINKRTALFIKGLQQCGYGVRVFAWPRRSWDFTAFESAPPARAGFVEASTAPTTGGRPQVVLATHWLVLPLAIALRPFGCRVYYDECDDYALLGLEGSFLSRWVTPPLVALIHRAFLPLAEVVFCIHMAGNELARKLSTLGANVVEINNYPTEDWLRPDASSPAGPLCAIYSGGIWREKGCESMVEALQDVRSEGFDVEMHIFGTGDNNLMRDVSQKPGIVVHGIVPSSTIRNFLHTRRCVGMALYENTPRYRKIGTNSHKVFEYLAAGAPVVSSPLGELPSLISPAVGCLVDPHDARRQVAAFLRSMARDTELWTAMSAHCVEDSVARQRTWEREWRKVQKAISEGPD